MDKGIEALIADMKAAAEKATPGRIGDRIDGSGSIKYECLGLDKTLVLRTDHKNMEYGFIGDNGDADEVFFRLSSPENVLALIAALEQAQQESKSQLAALTNTVELWNEQRTRIAELENTLRGTEESLIAAVDQIAELEAAPNGMMQLSNELAEMKRSKFVVNLPAACADDEYFIDGVFQPMRYERDIERAIIAAGGTVEGS